ncbi:MAG: hypothetical protein MUE55_06795 [Thermoplasmata archaeon]|nr:hypothetical protein [Thermoplasmata archaeon]
MSNDAPRHLDGLPVGKLKAIARFHAVDTSSCKSKKDYIGALASAGITEQQVHDALSSDKNGKKEVAGRKDADAAMRDVEDIARKSPEVKVLPAKDDEEVERNIDRALMVRPSFFEVESQVEGAWNHMIMADYHDALKANSQARVRMLDRFSSFQVFSSALSIRAAESIISSLNDAEGKVDPRLRSALAEAKRAFVDGSPRHREETLEELETLASKAYESFFEGSTKAEAELRTLLADYESFGAQTQESKRLLEIAEQARQAFNVAEYAKLLDDARQAAVGAKERRAAEIDRSFGMARSALHEAREAGAVLAVGEKELTEARDAFDRQAFKRATDLIAAVERTADQAHLERMRDRAAMERQTARVSGEIAGLESTLREAAAYGMDVEEGLLFVSKAKSSFVSRDIVTAAKYVRVVKDRSAAFQGDLDKKRVERGIAKKVEDARCGKCGKEALYSFPNDRRKCMECGHSFSMVVAPLSPTMEPIEKPVSSAPQEGGSPEKDEAPAEDTPRKGLLSRKLRG